MKICMILEGSYPFVRGGVSKWVDDMIRAQPEHEFIIWAVGDKEEKRGKYVVDLPQNVTSVHEAFLDTALKQHIRRNSNVKLKPAQKEAVSQLIRCENPDLNILLNTFESNVINPVELFMSEAFLEIVKEFCRDKFPFAGFTDLFWTVRSMFLPLLYLVGQPLPEADLYHSCSTGYAGVLGTFASMKYNKPYIVTEHGIYTREREEEILRSDWVVSYFKELWISMFFMFSRFAYQEAHQITCLFQRAAIIQEDLGCPPEKISVIGNGIKVENFKDVSRKEDDDWIDIAAIVRIAPIKDIKTMIYSFSQLKQEMSNARLHILGAVDDEEYHKECLSLIDYLNVKDIIFPGFVDIKKYLEKIDFTLLTSLSEGQPYAIIESMAAGLPLVATDVGSCRELIKGDNNDRFGSAGIYVTPMHQSEMLEALLEMSENKKMRARMSAVGRQRVNTFYNIQGMIINYQETYQKAIETWQASGSN
ncbi:MAG: GT4 family glycosyltransferase PelF [Pelolinea sp.]|nr:GT4 family glycosyltransferase PelF [Pelolinea sp.]